MNGLLYVILGGGIGAAGRYVLGTAMTRALGSGFPWGTFIANILGGFLMGALVGWLAFKGSGTENVRLFLGVGVLGGFTTFSSFSLESLKMIEAKAYGTAMGYMSASVIISVVAVCIGLILARKVFAL